MNEYDVEYFFRNGNQVDVKSESIQTCFSPYELTGVKRLEKHIKNKKNYDKVVITHIKRKGA